MKPPAFEYVAAADLDEALETLAEPSLETRPLAGGQSLVPMLNFRLAAPERLVDLNGIEELSRIEETGDGGLRLGAMVRHRQLESDPLVARRVPLLAEAAPFIAHPQIRSRGTVGGSVAHADPAAELPAVLLTLGARVRIVRRSRGGEPGSRVERTLDLDDFFLGPFFSALEPDELLTAIDVPPSAPGEGTAFDEVARRRGDYALAGVAARVRLNSGGVCEDAAISLVNGGSTPCLMREAAQALVGAEPTLEALEAAAATCAETSEPAADMHASEAYRRHLIRVLTKRVLSRAADRART
ncbi:xanthine dehydrogenase family protein subunit M [Candidatus Palauibacter soopunensis]|uniref:FAD binding domain-containing protein n=1 Tax=Candidatus Palauibacter soopunensis TaxID=3056739 RepID=UPI00238F67ED|nr:xanthine dehydrogenase family protein subunit M [Candidatus Palauibacter soopunensis]MDE2878175.1 xanthine dehydrogenase family protein subunit M [Candidatus Palauibacter soopunensis]